MEFMCFVYLQRELDHVFKKSRNFIKKRRKKIAEKDNYDA